MQSRVRFYFTDERRPTVHRVDANVTQPWEAWASHEYGYVTQINGVEALAAIENGARLVDLYETGRQAVAEIRRIEQGH
jgi:hypothetical protein